MPVTNELLLLHRNLVKHIFSTLDITDLRSKASDSGLLILVTSLMKCLAFLV